jgi:hypothetical protein
VRALSSWWSAIDGATRSWLILGKGPSFARLGGYQTSRFSVIALNHVVRELPVEVASAIDLDVVADCAASLRANARYLLMPRYPHLRGNARGRPLESFFAEIPILRELSDAGRLVWYNLTTGPSVPGSPVIRCGYFSAEVIVNLLGTMGARTVRTLGVDGGTTYAQRFADLNDRTRLANGQPSFDLQFRGIARAIQRFDLDFGPLTSEVPMRVFIGTDASQMLGARVLEYSIRRNGTSTSVFDTMQQVEVPSPRDPRNQPRTQFSFHRFAIPRLTGYQGRAVYVDADMLVFRDLRELWELPFDGATVLHAPASNPRLPKQFSVLLLDCNRLNWDVEAIVRGLDEGRYDYDGLMKELCIEPPEAVQARIPPDWNSLERYVPGRTALIHYTNMRRQPWVSRVNWNGSVWVRALRDAIHDRFISRAEVREAIARGHARPSLLWQLGLPRPVWFSFNMTLGAAMDLPFRPHRQLRTRLQGAR